MLVTQYLLLIYLTAIYVKHEFILNFIPQTIRKDIDSITKQQEDENMRLYQSIHKMQDRLDETFLRASDTKQMGREIIKNTEDLLRGTTSKVR